MKPTESQIENILRHAPRPQTPEGLKESLTEQINLPPSASRADRDSLVQKGGWLRRWWPVLAPATASLACAVVIMVQQGEITSLKESIRSLNGSAASVTNRVQSEQSLPVAENITADPSALEAAEIAQLKNRVESLTSEIALLETMQKANEGLRKQAAPTATLSQEETDALKAAKERAMSIHCINNMKQIGLAVRIFANDDDKHMNSADFLSMSNELNTPKILVCPADTGRVVAKTWTDYTAANASYEYLAPSVTNADADPERVLLRCPIHGHVGLCDGSVQGKVANDHPEWLVQREGKLYMQREAQISKPANP